MEQAFESVATLQFGCALSAAKQTAEIFSSLQTPFFSRFLLRPFSFHFSMKQTNNALKFLLAQYRAVFKNAYFKGLTTAMVVTAGLVAGQAQATNELTNTILDRLTSADNVTVNGNTTAGDAKYNILNIQGSSTWNATVTVTAGQPTASANFIIDANAAGDASVSGTGSLIIDSATNSTVGVLVGTYDTNGQTVTVDIGTIDVQKGTLDIKDSAQASKSGAATVIADTIKVGAAGIVKLTSASGEAVTLGDKDSSITLTDGSQFVINGGADVTKALVKGKLAGTGVLNFEGNGTIQTYTDASGADVDINVGSTSEAVLELDPKQTFKTNGTITLGDTTDSGTFTVKTGTLALGTSGAANIGNDTKSGSLTVSGDASLISEGEINISSNGKLTNSGDVTIANGTLTNAGTISVKGSTENATLTIADGATLALASTTTNITKGTLTIEDGATLTATVDGAAITLADTDAVLNIGADTLNSFLTADKVNGATEDDLAGTITLTNGEMNISGGSADEPVDLTNENLDLTDGKVNGDFLAVSKTIVGSHSSLEINAKDTLTLGGGKSDDKTPFVSSDPTNGKLGFTSATTKNVVFKADAVTNKDFTLQNKVILSAVDVDDDGVPTASTGTITGNLIVSGGSLEVQAGSYTASNKITLSSGDIVVGKDGNTLQSSLDLSSTEVAIGSGNTAFTIGQLGTLTINDKAAAEIVKSGSNNTTTISSGGTLNINGNVTAAATDFSTSGAHFLFAGDANEPDVNNEAHLNIDGDLTLTGPTSNAVSIGQHGFLQANNWQIEGTGANATTHGKATFGAGNYTVLGGLATAKSQDTDLVLGDNAKFTFGSNASNGGDIATYLDLSGAGAEANILAGTWTTRDIKVSDGTLNVGLAADDAATTTINSGRYKLTVAGGTANFSKNTEARFEGLEVTNGHLDVAGKLTVSGKYVAEVKDATGKKVVTPATWGVNLTGGTIGVHGANANLTFGSEVLKSLQTTETEDGAKSLTLHSGTLVYEFADSSKKPTDANKLAAGGTALFNHNISVYDNGTLTLDFDDNVVFTDESLRALRKGLLSTIGGGTNSKGDALKQGYIDLGGASIVGINPDDDGYISYDVLANYSDIANLTDVINDALSNSIVVDVGAGDAVTGNVGAVRVDGSTASAYFDDATLNNAAVNNGYFVTNETGKPAPEDMRIIVNSGANFGLNNGGIIGNVVLTAGAANDLTTFTIKDGELTTIESLTGHANSQVNVDGNTLVKGNSTVDNLRVDQALTVNGDTTVNGKLTSSLDPTTNTYLGELTTTNLTVAGDATYGGNITTTKDASFNQNAELQGNVTVGETMTILGNLTSAKNDKGDYLSTGEIKAKNLDISGSVAYGGNITTTGDVTIAGSWNDIHDAKGNRVLLQAGKVSANNLSVAGDTAYIGDISVANKATFGSDASLLGNNTFKDVFVGGELGFYASPEADGAIPVYKTTLDNLTFTGDNSKLEIQDGVTVSAGVIQGLKGDTSTAVNVSVGDVSGSSAGEVWDDSTGYLMADRIDLQGGTLKADPDFGQAASIVTVGRLGSAAAKADSVNAGSLNGNVYALRNSIIAIGVDNKTVEDKNAIEQIQNTFGKYLDKETLSLSATGDNAMGAILYVAKPLTVENGSKLVVDAATTNNTLAAAVTNKYEGSDAYIGANSAIAVNANSAQQLDADGKVVGAAVTFNKDDAKVYADKDAKIVLVGNFDTNKAVKVFADKKDGVEFTTDSAKEITVTSASNLYQGTMVVDEETGFISDDVSLKYVGSGENNGDDSTPDPWAGVSTPVHETLDTYAKFIAANPDYDHDSDFLYYAVRDDVVSAEKVARLGAFGGAAQAALAAGSTTYEAVSGRMGVGAAGTNITVADNTQGAALWLTPVYKNRDSDGFGADGVDYGADLDLYGVALGADYTLANGFKVGAAFNIGSGDADGNGAGEGVSNDFDYYGFAIYGGYTYGPWSVVADISYTNVDNDVDVTTDLGKFDTSFDSSNLSVGVTAQYQAELDGGVLITPHAGLRYTKIDLDDYTVKFEDGGDVAAYSSDDLSIFSIPVGVTVAKEFVNGTWTIKPSFDLTLTANMGDDSADGSVNWGVTGLENTAVSSEVLDNFTYGATVGVAAKSGNFSLGFGLNYTGSSNTDEFGVNANARFVF